MKTIKRLMAIAAIAILIITNVSNVDSFAKESINRKHKRLIQKELCQEIDSVECIDKYKKGKWFVYYVYAEGDVYVITVKNNAVDVCCHLN